jgi:probable HAF family extracellular repeat protein
MKSKTLTSIAAMILSAAALALPVRAVAQDQQKPQTKPVRYSVRILGTLGGTSSVGNSVNNKGWVVGTANLKGDIITHAALWRNGVITDLGTLGAPNSFPGGPNSFINFPVKNERGEIEGFSETSAPDPLKETFCAGLTFGTFAHGVTCLGFLWQDGVMVPLPPLPGGNNSEANGINNRGQVVGVTENRIQDKTCTAPQQLQLQAVIWGPKKGQMQRLPPLSGDPDGLATAINDNGEVTGCSGICADLSLNSCLHAVVWKDGSPTNIGGLGPLNVGGDINNNGQVLGESLLPDNATYHSFLWQKGVVTDLGALPGRPLVFAGGLNNKGQVVGHACDATDTFCTAYLWENGVMTDLNTLIPAGVYLYYAGDINDRGEIAGVIGDPVTGASGAAFLAIPCDEEHAHVEGCEGGPAVLWPSGRPRAVRQESVREQLQQLGGFRQWVRHE